MKLKSCAAAGLACALFWAAAARAFAQEESAATDAQAGPVPLEGSLGASALLPVSPDILGQGLSLGALDAPGPGALAPAAVSAAVRAPAVSAEELPAAVVEPTAAAARKSGAASPAGALQHLKRTAARLSRPGASTGAALRGLLDGETGASGENGAVLAADAPPAPSRLRLWVRGRLQAWKISRFQDDELPFALTYANKTPTPAVKKKITRMAKRLLRRHGVAYREAWQNRLVILPEGGSRLNRFAAAVQRQFSAEVEFCVDRLVDFKAGAYYSSWWGLELYKGGTIGLPAASVVSGRPFAADDAMASHEMVHMVTHKRDYADASDPIHGHIDASPALKDDPVYGKHFSLDELDAYDLTQRVLAAKAQTAYERRQRGLPAPYPSKLVNEALFYCERLRAMIPAVFEADQKLLELAGRLRAGEGERNGVFTHLPGGMITVADSGWVRVSFDPFTSGMKYVFLRRGLNAQSSRAELADALTRQAEDFDDIAANKDYALQKVLARLERLFKLLCASRKDPAAVRRAFAELKAAERWNPATENQRRSWARR